MGEPSPAHCRLIVPLLNARGGHRTELELSDHRSLIAYNIAWGEDIGDDYEHLTTNISPAVDGTDADLFFTDEVAKILDPETRAVLWETDGTPNVR